MHDAPDGIGCPGPIVWSRVFVEGDRLHSDLGSARVVRLPDGEVERRRADVTRQWPLVSVITDGISRDQFMARHLANHMSIAYAESPQQANDLMLLKASTMTYLGIQVHLCGSAGQDATNTFSLAPAEKQALLAEPGLGVVPRKYPVLRITG